MLLDDLLIGLDGVTYNSNYEPGEERVQFFVDDHGRTIYIFIRDTKDKNNFTRPDFSNDPVWPIFEEDLQSIPSTLDASLFGSIDVFGKQQLTYNGWPLYYFGQDTARGENVGVSVPQPGIWPVAVKGLQPAPEINIKLADNATLGKVLTDQEGNTLYFFTRDAMPDTSLCSGGCLNTWPVFYAETPVAGEGLSGSDFGTITNSAGQQQTTYKGWPLYYYVGDENPGDTNGEARGNVWFVAKPDYSIMLLDDLLIGLDGITYNSNYEPGEERVQFFVDDHGRTLYIFTRDTTDTNTFTNPDFSNNEIWPIFEEALQGIPSVLSDTLFGSIDVFGRQQLTYKGWPLYYFGQDTLRGENKGVSVPSPGVWPVAIQNLEPAQTTAVNEVFSGKLELTLSPVPANDYLRVDIDSKISAPMQVGIYDLTGRKLQGKRYELIPGKNDIELNVSYLSSGLYILVLNINNQAAAYQKFVKE
jgi:predicted lipoprotein with Yx(FWY)xxD motif